MKNFCRGNSRRYNKNRAYNFALRPSLYFLSRDSTKEIVYGKQRCDQCEGELLARIRREKARIWQKTVEIN